MSENEIQVINKRGEIIASDGSSIVPDGCGVRVPLMLMDSVQRAVAEDLRITDAFGAEAGHRPGYVFASPTRLSEARDAAYNANLKLLEDAWRSPSTAARPAVADRTLGTRDAEYETHKAWLRDAWRTAL